jgi:hypothetical protein
MKNIDSLMGKYIENVRSNQLNALDQLRIH